jgi:hypothetical protein
MHDDDDSELFEGRLEISRTENGASFGLDEESYFRMATCAMNASGMGIEPSVICRLPDSERGCKLVSFGRTHAFSVVARVFRSRTTIALVAEPLDGLHCTIPLREGQDCDVHLSRALRCACARPNPSLSMTSTGRLNISRARGTDRSRFFDQAKKLSRAHV